MANERHEFPNRRGHGLPGRRRASRPWGRWSLRGCLSQVRSAPKHRHSRKTLLDREQVVSLSNNRTGRVLDGTQQVGRRTRRQIQLPSARQLQNRPQPAKAGERPRKAIVPDLREVVVGILRTFCSGLRRKINSTGTMQVCRDLNGRQNRQQVRRFYVRFAVDPAKLLRCMIQRGTAKRAELLRVSDCQDA